MNINLREISKSKVITEGGYTTENINAGSLQRIADAAELMAKNNQLLIEDRDRYRKWYYEKLEQIAKLHNSIRAYRGAISKLKRKATT